MPTRTNSSENGHTYLVRQAAGQLEYQLPISVKLVIDIAGRVPLLFNERSEWELPGGKLELGETPEGCVAREVREELNLSVTPEMLLSAWVYRIAPDQHAFIVTFGATYHGQEELEISREHRDLRLFRYSEISALPMPAPYKDTIERWQNLVAGKCIVHGDASGV